MTAERILHRGTVQKVTEVRAKTVIKAVGLNYPDYQIAGVVNILLRVEWFRTTDSLIYERAHEFWDKKLESSFDNVILELVIPFLNKPASDRWTVLFPNEEVELSTAPTELTIEHDNIDLLFKKQEGGDYLRSARPEVGGRILFFPQGKVLLVSILEQPVSQGVRIDVPIKRPVRPSLAEYEQKVRNQQEENIVFVGQHPKFFLNKDEGRLLTTDEVEALFA